MRAVGCLLPAGRGRGATIKDSARFPRGGGRRGENGRAIWLRLNDRQRMRVQVPLACDSRADQVQQLHLTHITNQIAVIDSGVHSTPPHRRIMQGERPPLQELL
jgi:hypothetical protein